MIGAALYLITRSSVNATRRRLARLRQPKYLVGFAVGCLYVYWLIFRRNGGSAFSAASSAGGDVTAIAVLAVLVILNWIFGSAETPFTFSLAETDYLFTAPLTRRQVIDFKLLRSQLPLLISAALSALFLSGGRVGGLRPSRVIGLWLVYGTLQLHYGGMALLRASLAQYGVTGLRRRAGTLLLLGAVLGLAGWSLQRQLPELVAAFQRDSAQGYEALAGALHSGLLGVLVWPLEAVVAPLRAAGTPAFVSRLPAALLVFAVHYIWVVRSTLAFEEAAVEHAAKVARRIEAIRQGRSPTRAIRVQRPTRALVPRLAATGTPGVAILWKNTIGATRDAGPRWLVLASLLVIGTALVLGGPIGSGRGGWGGLAILAVMLLALGAVALFLGPLSVRFDLRQDLEMLDVLKSYPLSGREIVSGEVAAPVTLLGGVVWSCLFGVFLATLGQRGMGLPALADRVALLLALLPATVAIVAVLVVVQNAAVLLFPAWVTVGQGRAVGLEATGQRILMTAVSMVALVITLAPAVIVGGIAGVAASAVGLRQGWALAVGTLAGSAVVALEGGLAVHLLGRVFDRIEPAAGGLG
ncbi:MAG TPA: putative ABC exporter domain-containing protein [Gemmatimonadales bacterium]|nr:putative ABC exporter domain-containing protein [Gemmatimonadales bacterium]